MTRRRFLASLGAAMAGLPFVGRAFASRDAQVAVAPAEAPAVDLYCSTATLTLKTLSARTSWSYELELNPPRACDTCLTEMPRHERAFLRRGGKPQRCRRCRRSLRRAGQEWARAVDGEILGAVPTMGLGA